MFESWILQVLLSEMLDVPATIETGSADAKLNFYDPDSAFGYGTSNDWDGLKRGTEILDCRNKPSRPQLEVGTNEDDAEYESCGGHVIVEVWNGQLWTALDKATDGIVEAPVGQDFSKSGLKGDRQVELRSTRRNLRVDC